MEPTAIGSALGAAGVRNGLQLGRNVRAAASGVAYRAGAYRVATRTACYYWWHAMLARGS